jgi:hypothetical protein
VEDHALQGYDGPTDDLCVVNLVTDGPAFKGDLDVGINWRCSNCNALIAKAVYASQLLNLLFRCYSCRQVGASPVREAGQPLAGRPVVLDRGEFYLKTVDVTGKPTPIAGYQARLGYLNETAAPSIPFATATGGKTELSAPLLRELASRAITLLGPNYRHLKASAKKSAASRTPKRSQPRLMELISYAELAADTLEARELGTQVDLDADQLSELYGTITMFDRWRNHPAWPQLANTLASVTEGPHSLMLLTAASYLSDSGNGVGIVFKKTTQRIPDLWIEPDLAQRINIEVKTPQAFRGSRIGSLSTNEVETVLVRQIDKAASSHGGQLGTRIPGIVAIGLFHLPAGGLDRVLSGTERVLARQARMHRKPNLVGVLLSEFGFTIGMANVNTRSLGFTATLTNRFVPYRGYRGTVKIEEGLPRWARLAEDDSNKIVPI